VAGIRWRADFQHRYTPMGGEPPYYWTSVYYYENLGSTPFTGGQYASILDATYSASLDTVELVSIRFVDTTHNTEYGIVTPLDNLGTLDAENGGTLHNVIRLSGKAGGREVSHKLWRFPLRDSDLAGSYLSSQAMDIVNGVIIPGLEAYPLCNIHGVEVEEWECDGLIHCWQVRHGTKRRERVVYAYP